MITRKDLKIVDTYMEGSDNTVWAHVEYDGQRYILTSTNVTDEVLNQMEESDPLSAMFTHMGLLPRRDNGVFRGDVNWQIVGECGPQCESGLCTKRLASDSPESPTIEHAIDMLLRFLNN